RMPSMMARRSLDPRAGSYQDCACAVAVTSIRSNAPPISLPLISRPSSPNRRTLLRRLPRTVAELGVELVDEIGGCLGDVGAGAEDAPGARCVRGRVGGRGGEAVD